ncbi:MAG: hypothetical protein LBG83_01290 [Oscillospiraceae bacterium]|jgi:hypothetical protein|nr:hypothetical protein [Oscillospiraceae bacterium]
MKRSLAILFAALLFLALLAACGDSAQDIAAPTGETASYSYVTEQPTTEDLWETETTQEETTTEESTVSTTAVPTTQRTTTRTTTARTTTTTRTTARTTTTKAKTTTQTTSYPTGSSFGIASKEGALAAFNAAVDGALNGKASFDKSHKITWNAWSYDPAISNGLNFALFDSVDAMLDQALNTLLGKGIQTASAVRGASNSLLASSRLTMSDLNSADYSGTKGGEWTITLSVKNGETRQRQSGFSGSSPIDKGPLQMATGEGNIYDHMDAGRLVALIKSSQLGLLNIDPIDVQENTSAVNFVAKLDGGGALRSLNVSYSQLVNLREIKILNGETTYKDNTGTSSVSITYDNFGY